MGEAKRRRLAEESAAHFSKALKRARFNLLTMGTRLSQSAYMCEEVSWWSALDDRILGMVARDTTDDDYFWMVLLRDRSGRFRCANLDASIRTADRAEALLRIKMAELIASGNLETEGEQGDEAPVAVDLFAIPPKTDPKSLHPYFRLLAEDPGRAPARKVFQELSLWLAPNDPHLAKEFQGAGFDQRLWELYLWAVFREFFFDVEHLEAPDFRCTAPGVDFTVEATAVAPSMDGVLADHPPTGTKEEIAQFLENYMPMKFGSALTAKLNKKNAAGLHYWQRKESINKPFLLAIADFHEPIASGDIGSMTYTQSALWQYLYGTRIHWDFEDDKLVMHPEKIEQHQFKEKIIPSGFFDLPNAENISAVLFSNAGTMAKFDRMGVAAGYGVPGYEYYRVGLKYNPDPNAIIGSPFTKRVGDDDYEEWWTQEVQIFHNPNAKRPIPFEVFLGATHHFFEDGQMKSLGPDDAVLSSYTWLFKVVANDVKLKKYKGAEGVEAYLAELKAERQDV